LRNSRDNINRLSDFPAKRDTELHAEAEETEMTSQDDDEVVSITCLYCARQFIGQSDETCKRNAAALRFCINALIKNLASLAHETDMYQSLIY
jgi:hypothetical protein